MLKIEFIGYLGGDAKVATTQTSNILTFDVGVSRRDGAGNKVTTWIKCSKHIDSSGGNVAQYLVKGTRVFVRGDLSVTAYENKNGAPMPSINCRVQELNFAGNEQK